MITQRHKSVPLLLLTAYTILTFFSCQKTNLVLPAATVSSRPAADFFKNNYEFRLLYAAIQKAGLTDSLNGPGPFTIFAPTDNAFNLAGFHSPADFATISPDSLRFLIKYHILNRRLFFSDIPASIDNLYPNSDGLNLYLTLPDHSINYAWNIPFAVNGDTVSNTNVITSNAIVHVLTRVLNYNKGTVQSILAADTNYSYFVMGLKTFHLWDSLKTAGPYTILAPNNDAFRLNGITLDSLNMLTPSAYSALLFSVYILHQHHIFTADANYYNPGPFTVPIGGNYLNFPNIFTNLGLFILNSSTNPSFHYSASLAFPWALHLDRLASNGIVDGINNLLILPSDAHK